MSITLADILIAFRGDRSHIDRTQRAVERDVRRFAARADELAKTEFTGDSRPLHGALTQAEEAVRSSAGRMQSMLAGAFSVALGGLLQRGIEAVGGAMRGGIGLAIDYQQTMNLLRVNSGATGDEMAQLATLAKQLGSDMELPGTSAADAAAAMLELNKAGLSLKDTMTAARGVLQLSAAGDLSNAQAAEIAANALNSFGLAGERASAVADLLAGTASRSSVSVQDVGEAFKMASGIFNAFQGPAVGAEQAMVDLSTAIGILGNMGVKGSDAGTSLKQMLLMLTNPADQSKRLMRELAASVGVAGDIAYTADGRMRPFQETLDLLGRSTANLTEEQRNYAIGQIFGADASRSVIQLLQAGPAAFAEMQTAITRQGAAAELAGAKMAGLGGALDGLKSTIETQLLEGIEPFLPLMERVVRGAAALLGSIPVGEWAQAAAGLITPVADAVGMVLARLGGAGQRIVAAIMPVFALIWGVFEPLVRVAWQWGIGFIMAFADGISAAVGLVAKAIGGLATLITSLLRPRSPPKILPDLARWGTQAAEVWMQGWKAADFQQLTAIGSDIGTVLATLVGRGDLAEVDSIPLLQRTKVQLAELLTSFRQTGEVSQEAMERLRSAAGPAGQAVGDLVEGYLNVERTSRDAARAQEELNDVTERYDAILNPLTAELDGVRRRMQDLRDAERLAKLKQQLATATGPERELIQLEMRELALNRQISAEQTAMKQAQDAAKAKVDAAKQEEQAAKDRLADMQARQKYEADAVALANKQTALLEQLAKQASETGSLLGGMGGSLNASMGGMGAALTTVTDVVSDVRSVVDGAKEDVSLVQERVGGLLDTMAAMRQRGATITAPFAAGMDFLGARVAHLSNALRYLATGQMTAALVAAFAPGSALVQGLVEMRYQIVRFGIEAQATGRLILDSLRFLLTGEVSQGMAAAFGPSSPVMQGLLALRTRLVAVSTSAAQGLRLVRASMRFLVTGEVAGGVAGILAAGGGLATLLTTLRQRLVTLGPAAAALGQQLRDGFTQMLANPQAALATLGARLQAAGSDLLATGQAWAEQILAGLLDRLPDGVRERVAMLGPLLLSAFAAVVGGLTLGPLVAGMLLPIGAVVAPLAGLFAPLGAAFAAMGGWVRMLVPSAAGLSAAFRTLMQPMALLQPLLNGIGAAALLLGSYLRAPFATLGRIRPLITGSVLPALARVGPLLLNLRTPITTLFTLGRTLLGFFSPLGILITLVGAFVGAFVSNTNGIRDLTIGAFDPLLQIMTRIGPILWNVLGLFARGDWAGGLNLLRVGLRDLAPILGSAATALQQGIPAIFAAMMQYLGMLGSQILAWLGAALPPIISALGAWALALLDWIAPMIPPMLAALGGLLAQLLEALGAALPGIIEALAGFVAAFIDWVIIAGPPLLRELGGLLADMYGWMARQVPGIAGQLGTWVLEFIGWVSRTVPPLLLALGGLLASFLGWITEKAPDILATLAEWGRQFALWVTTQGIPALVTALGQMFTGLWEELKRLWNAAFADGSIGASLIEGLKAGIQRNWAAFANWFVAKLRSILPEWAGGTDTSTPAPPGGPAGARAKGGPVRRGSLYLVGEEGPEYFEPGADGVIHPNSVYAALNRPLTSLNGLQDAAVAQRTTLPASGSSLATPAATPVAVTVNLAINHPVLASQGQQEQFTQEILALMRGEVTSAITRILLAGGS